MDFDKLKEHASIAISQLDKYVIDNGASDQIKSIREQMKFIRENADQGKDPTKELGDKKFTYAIIASREFSSPNELELKQYLDEVSKVLDEK